MNCPKISIVTPSYNQGRYIEQTILSVIEQKYPNLEYIIIDGGSTDGTVEIIKKYEHHLTYWISEPDKGQTDAINKGFAKCTGEIFNWINSDDYYEPGSLEKLGAYFKENPAINVVCGKEWAFKDANPSEKTLHPGSIIKDNVFETIRIGIIDQPCTFFRKKAIEDFFPLNVSLKYVMDRQLWWSYLLKYGQNNILQTNEVLTNFRLHSQSKSIGDADLFEAEFDRLKFSLFKTLSAPSSLQQQPVQIAMPLDCKWKIGIKPVPFILAAFASFYAERNYINDKFEIARELMWFVKKSKGWGMTRREWKLWIKNGIPKSLLVQLKKIKHHFHYTFIGN